ncbi:integrase catalytic domain-containing protein [Caerostris darwini]|uniref:Integrase catalytic domain-containing protein n=1 Tax=Caerostris darwini TaxID=1538125 RepID=A0AAV4RUJ4_9ARAC|nr:integrase catalytic domain-containing protein [Caerostris darwini]
MQIFPGFREFTFLHTLTHILVNKSSLYIREIELMIQTCPNFSNSSNSRHANIPLDLSKISRGSNRWSLNSRKGYAYLKDEKLELSSLIQTLYFDRDPNFFSAVMNEVYEKLGISKQQTLAYNPQGNGLVERLNETLIDTLSHLRFGKTKRLMSLT